MCVCFLYFVKLDHYCFVITINSIDRKKLIFHMIAVPYSDAEILYIFTENEKGDVSTRQNDICDKRKSKRVIINKICKRLVV